MTDKKNIQPFRAPEMKLEIPVSPDEEVKRIQNLFIDGIWMPSADPLVIGPENFSAMQNLRFAERCLEGVPGYTKINPDTALATYPKIRSGIQLTAPFTTKSRILVQAYNSALSASQILQNKTAVPIHGDFETAALHTDAAGAGLGRFCKWPGNQVAYCNGVESKIYGGDEIPCAAFLISSAAVTGATLTNPKDFSEQMRNNRQTSDQEAVIGSTGVFLVGFTRPVQGVKLYVAVANSSLSSITGQEHNGIAWSAITITDGTKPGSVSLAQTGSLAFSSTVASSIAKLIEGRVLYWYQFALSAGSATIYQVTGDAPFQDVRDVWDGTGLLLSSCLVYAVATTSYKDFTLQAAEASEDTVIALGALATTEHWLLGSPVPLMGFNIRMSSDATKVNGNAAVMTVKYCNGDAIASWPAVTSLTDGTSADGKSLRQPGTVSFTPITPGQEFMVSINGGESMYDYKVTFSAALSATVNAWYIDAIPSPQPVKAYKFPFSFLGRPMLCGYLAGNEGNRVDYAMSAASDVWNGPDSSGGVDNAPLYFGGSEELTAACEVYNRLGSSIYSFAIFTKEYETYIVNGYDAETYRIYSISSVHGCPAPLTMDTYQVGISKDAQSVRSIAMWLSHAGPVMFDSGGLMPVPGLECYFDRRDSRCINSAAIENARGWFDPDTGDYHLQIPSGIGQTANNVWVALSVKHQKWYPIVPSAPLNPCLGAAFHAADTDGRQYMYGARDNGYMMRIHDPDVATWDGISSVQSITLGDLLCSGNIWDRIRLRFLKLFGISTTEDLDASVTHYADGAAAGTELDAVALNAAGRYFKDTQAQDLLAWSHQIKITATISTEKRGMRLLGWGMEYLIEREDL